MKTKKHKQFNFLIAAVIIASIIVISLKFLPFFLPFEQKEIDMSLTVSNYTGIDVNTSILSFGTAMKSAKVSREIIITNEYNKTIRARLSVSGELSKWAELSEKSLVIQANQEKKAAVSIMVPEDARNGNYTGKLRISFTK